MNKFLTNNVLTFCGISPWRMLGLVWVLLTPFSAKAEYLGLILGRSANPANLGDLSLEAGFVSGQLGSLHYRHLGVRLNSRVAPNVVVFGDVGTSEFGTSDGVPIGLGALYHFNEQKFNPRLDVSVAASYHAATFRVSDARLTMSGLALQLVVGVVAAEGISGYVNVGYHQIDSEFGGFNSSKELGFGAGMSLALGSGEAYAGFDFIDEVTLGLGFRYFIQPTQL